MIRAWSLVVLSAFAAAAPVGAQHLIWQPIPDGRKLTCLYGEIEVLATGPTIYYCGCNWWPGNPAGGYCGIQDAGGGRHLTIFSIWDTSPTLHPRVTQAEARTQHNRFGGEGEGAHTHLDYDWPLKRTFRYYVAKEQSPDGDSTLTRMYFYDEGRRGWVHEATISSPNDGHESVKTFGGMLNAFLENWSGRERATPKLALYRLWVGTSPKDLTHVARARGDGNWGVLNGSFCLAEGDDAALAGVFDSVRKAGTTFEQGRADRSSLSVPPRRVPASVIRQLEHLPQSPAVGEPGDGATRRLGVDPMDADYGKPAGSYRTGFQRNENPISEGRRWINGGREGLDWFDVIAHGGAAYGAATTGEYTDPTALLAGAWGANQVARARVFSRNQTDRYYQEVELRLRSSIEPHRCSGYEVFWRCLKTPDAYVQIVRWNGKVRDWTSLEKRTGAQFGVKDGDVVEASIVGNVIKGYLNGVEVISAVDDTYAVGSPGIGFNYGVGDTGSDFGFTEYAVKTFDDSRRDAGGGRRG